MGLRFDCPVITVAGTNGKGSTCAMLEAIACRRAIAPASTPRRTWCISRSAAASAAKSCTPQALVPHFERVEAARQGVTLTYFEFTTLAILGLHGGFASWTSPSSRSAWAGGWTPSTSSMPTAP